MTLSAPPLLPLLLLSPCLALRHLAGVGNDPTAGGQMMSFSVHQPWVAGLFANRTLAQREAARLYPEAFEKLRRALADRSPTEHALEAAASSCQSMVKLANANHTAKPYLAAAGGLELATGILKVYQYPFEIHPDANKVLHRACAAALGTMALYQKDVQEEAGKAGAVELVLGMQKFWPDDPSMQMGGLSGCFLDFSEANRRRWAEAGGIEYALEVIRRHHNNSEAVLQSWFVFSSGTQNPNERAFVKAGGIAEAMRSMTEFKNYGRVREEAMQAMRALSRCPGCEDLQDALVQAGFLENIATAMTEVPMDIHIQSPGCANVVLLTRRSAAHRSRAVQDGLAELALQAVRSFPNMISSVAWAFDDQYTVYEDCVGALASLAKDERGKAILKEAGASQDVRAALQKKPTSSILAYEAAEALKALRMGVSGKRPWPMRKHGANKNFGTSIPCSQEQGLTQVKTR